MKTNIKFKQCEIDFIIENYPLYGAKYCAAKLNRTLLSILKKIERIKKEDKIDIRCTQQYKNPNLQQDKLNELASKAMSITDLCFIIYKNDFYGNRQTLKKYIKKYSININHFSSTPRSEKLSRKIKTLSEVLVENSSFDTTSLKHKLYKEGLKKEKCELCGQENMWMGKKMSLRLDHINGIHNDHRIENLRIVCPNCDATLDTFSGKNAKKYNVTKKENSKNNICSCGSSKYHESKQCIKCYNKSQSKNNKPGLPVLLEEVSKIGYSATGRKYGVSDNAIRKWIKSYQNN